MRSVVVGSEQSSIMAVSSLTSRPAASSIVLGYVGENQATCVVWPGMANAWRSLYGGGKIEGAHQRYDDESPYPIVLTETDAGDVVWTLSASDLAREGAGAVELSFFKDGALAKSKQWSTVVRPSITGGGVVDPPEPQKSWVDAVLAAGVQASASASAAAASAEKAEAALPRAPIIGTDGTWSVWDAADGGYKSTGISATGPQGPQGPRGYPANVNGVTPDNDGNITLSASSVDAVGYDTPQTLTDAQKQQARDNIGALGGNDDVAKESTSQLILSTLRGQRPKRYGFRIKNSEPNPSTRVEYIYDAEGMTPARMNFNTGVFDYGSWADIWFVRDNHPCMLKSDGAVDYWLKDDDYTQKYAAGSASDVSNTAYGGNCFSAIPLIWVKRYQEGDYSYTIFCEERYDDGYFAYAHTDAQGHIMPYLFYPAFRGSLVDGKLRSLKGQALDNGTTATAERTAAQANGSGYDILQWCDWQLLMDMCYLIGKSTNLQGTFGEGHTAAGTSAADLLITGTLSDKGRFYGYADTANAVKVFHTEVCWGARWERIVGCLQDHGVWKMKMTPEGSGYNLTGAGYDAVWETVSHTSYASSFGGWISAARNTPQGLLPTALTGSGTTYYCDYHYINMGALSVPVVGGSCGSGSWCGRSVDVGGVAGAAWWRVGASLSYKRPS